MKKLIGILSVATLALAMFINTSLINKSNTENFELSSLLKVTSAQAEDDDCGNWFWDCDSLYNEVTGDCTCSIDIKPGGIGVGETIPGTTDVCQSGGPDFCFPSYICVCGYV